MGGWADMFMAGAWAATIFDAVVCLGVPIAALVFFAVRRRKLVVPFLLGVIGFLVSQVVLRLPLLAIIQSTAGYAAFATVQPLLATLLVCLSAGLFEETARYLLLRNYTTHFAGFNLGVPLAYGLGHGGLEAILLVGANCLIAMFTPGMVGVVTGPMDALAGVERISAMMFHVGASIVIYQGVTRHKPGYLVLAILLHTAYNLPTGLSSGIASHLVAYEAVLFVASAVFLSVVIALTVRGRRRAGASLWADAEMSTASK